MKKLCPILLLLLASSVTGMTATVGVFWNPNTDGITKGYILYTLQAGVQFSKMDVGTNTTATVTGLANSTAYEFKVIAYDAAAKESFPSAPVTYTTPAALQPPPPVTVTAVPWSKNAVSGYDITPMWTASPTAASYNVIVKNASGTAVSNLTTASTTVKVQSLAAGAYTVSVRAQNAAGNSAYSADSIVSIVQTVDGVRVTTSTQ